MSAIVVASIAGLATVQDGGRPGRMHEGVPPGGALVPELLARANEAAGNAPDAAAIELFGAMTIEAQGDVVIATDDGEARALERGERASFPPSRHARVRYVALRGSIDVPRVLGGRGTLLVASIGGLEGRALRRGDRLHAGDGANAPPRALAPFALDLDAPIRITLGPDSARFTEEARRALTSMPFVLTAASDRTGARLTGPTLARVDTDVGVSTPMVAGAIEVPASGAPIVLGPDHPTTGGYPIIATIVRADLGRFAARRAGTPVTFHSIFVDPFAYGVSLKGTAVK
jgi:biotin-dependent carboxylase-like uncharacterized protein